MLCLPVVIPSQGEFSLTVSLSVWCGISLCSFWDSYTAASLSLGRGVLDLQAGLASTGFADHCGLAGLASVCVGGDLFCTVEPPPWQ